MVETNSTLLLTMLQKLFFKEEEVCLDRQRIMSRWIFFNRWQIAGNIPGKELD